MGWGGGGGSAQLRTAGNRKEAGDGGLHRTARNSRVWLERARENPINSSSSPPPLTDLFLRLNVLVGKKRSICGTKVGKLEPQGHHSVAGRPAWTHGRPGAPIKGTQRPETDGLVVQGRPPAFRGQEQLGQSARETNPPANDECVEDSWTSAGQSPCPAP